MSDYVFLYRGGERDGTPEEMQAVLQRWMTWIKELGENGHLRSPGEPLERGGKLVRDRTVITDGPYAESKDIIGGFSLVTASSLEEAAKLASGCPIFEFGGLVEVRPVMSMGG